MNIKPAIIYSNKGIQFAVFAMLVAAISACSGNSSAQEQESGGTDAGQEESGTQYALNESYDQVRNGARLTLVYDAQENSFVGTTCNTTDNTLKQVRVEIHLSNGVELGPTTPTDLSSGECTDVTLEATGDNFDARSAHPEVGESGSGEHGNGEGEGEQSEEGEGEYNEGGSY